MGAVYLPDQFRRPEILSMLGGGILILLLGMWDDIRHLSARRKFALQWVIASLVFAGGVRIMGANIGSIWVSTFPGWVSYLATTFWIVAATNALNLIDGSDGVAAGAALFASASLGVVFAINGDPVGALMATVLVGACLGFLSFNFPPASIFLGDSGSLFLGYTLATLGVITTNKASTIMAVAIPVVAFAVPLLDTSIAVVRRFLRREPIFGADRGHIHHRLGDLGHSPRVVVLLLYLSFGAFAVLSLLLTSPDSPSVLPIFVVAFAVLVVGVQRLKVPELTELSAVIGRGFQQRSVIAHNVKMKAATDGLNAAQTGKGIVDVLHATFRATEFGRIEVWVPDHLAHPLRDDAAAQGRAEGDGWLLAMRFADPSPGTEIEVRVPLEFKGEVVGRFSLYRAAEGDRLFTDLRLLPQMVVPALSKALHRVVARQREAPAKRRKVAAVR